MGFGSGLNDGSGGGDLVNGVGPGLRVGVGMTGAEGAFEVGVDSGVRVSVG